MQSYSEKVLREQQDISYRLMDQIGPLLSGQPNTVALALVCGILGGTTSRMVQEEGAEATSLAIQHVLRCIMEMGAAYGFEVPIARQD